VLLFWSIPLLSRPVAAAVGLVGNRERAGRWETSLLVLPLMLLVYRSYRLYWATEAEKERVEVEKRHVEEIASLNMRTIEALALALKPRTTPRTRIATVRTYAVAVANELQLPEDQIEALAWAALLDTTLASSLFRADH